MRHSTNALAANQGDDVNHNDQNPSQAKSISEFDLHGQRPGSNTPPSNSTPQSSARRSSPRLSAEGLTVLLAMMCVVPAITIFGLWSYLPPVYEGQLDCGVQAQLLPPQDFYLLPYKERTAVTQGEIVVENRSDTDWTHINIQVNTFYQIYDVEVLRAGESRTYVLNRFISKTGARFDLTYNPLKAVRVYARRPKGDRATFYVDFMSLPHADPANPDPSDLDPSDPAVAAPNVEKSGGGPANPGAEI